MKQVKLIINIIALLLCTNITLAQEKPELQLAIDSVEKIRYISLTDNDGWGNVPENWKKQEKLKALATDDDLARIATESKSPQARVFAYITLVEKKSAKCFDLLKNLKSAVYSLAQFKIKTGTNVFHFYMHLCNVFWGGREKS